MSKTMKIQDFIKKEDKPTGDLGRFMNQKSECVIVIKESNEKWKR